MPTVVLKVLTRWGRAARVPGETLDVPEQVAERWAKRGIATIQEPPSEPKRQRRRSPDTDEE